MQLEYLAAGFFIGSARLGLSGVFHDLLGQDSPSIFEKLGHLYYGEPSNLDDHHP